MSADENHGQVTVISASLYVLRSYKSLLQVGTRRYMSPEVLEGAMEFTRFCTFVIKFIKL